MPGRDERDEANDVRGFAARLLILAVRAYQIWISPMAGGVCRFEPTCSAYMIEAVKTHGAAKGFLLGLWRILRCRPFGASGYDPPPPRGRWRNDFNLAEKAK